MKGAALSSRDRRALLVGGAVLAFALLLRVMPAVARIAIAEAVAAQSASDRTAFAASGARDSARILSELSTQRARLEARRPELLNGGGGARLASELSALVTGAARDAGLDLLGATAVPDTLAPAALEVAEVRVEVQGDVSGVMQYLLLLEQAPGLLNVRELSVSQPEPAAPGSVVESLRASLLVTGVSLRRSTTRGRQ